MSAVTTPNPVSIREMQEYPGTLYVKNHSAKTITCNISKEPAGQFMLEAAGRDGDVKVLPKFCLEQAGFQKIVAKRQVTVSPDYGDESLEGSLRSDADRERQLAEINSMVEENSSSKDISQVECLWSTCSEQIFQSGQDVKDMVPPLCDAHKDRAHEFVGTEVPAADGSIQVQFNRATIG